MADATIFEKNGMPAAAIITSPFVKTADSMARRHGYVDFGYAQMPHPIGNLRPDQIKDRARDVLPQVMQILGLEGDAGPPK